MALFVNSHTLYGRGLIWFFRQFMAKKFRIPGVSYSWKRALGVTGAKRRIARATGIPTSRSGRQLYTYFNNFILGPDSSLKLTSGHFL